jgi:hypothetical protein
MSADALALAFRSFRLPTMAAIWEESVKRAEGENWGYRRLLQHLCESEAQDRRERRVSRLLKQSGLASCRNRDHRREELPHEGPNRNPLDDFSSPTAAPRRRLNYPAALPNHHLRIPTLSDTCSNSCRTAFQSCRTMIGAKRRAG